MTNQDTKGISKNIEKDLKKMRSRKKRKKGET